MGSLLRTAPRLIAVAIILFGCAPGPASAPARSAPSTALPSTWAVDPGVVADTTAPTADTLYTIGVWPQANSALPVVVPLGVIRGVDLRELLDGMVISGGGHRPDVVVTSDADVLAYARGRADYLVAALPWTITYLLVPARASSPVTLPSLAERDALARNAVTLDARGAAEPFPWLTDSACGVTAAVPMGESRPVVAYFAGDATARQLAERITSLASANAGTPWVAAAIEGHATAAKVRIAGLPADSFVAALASGGAAATVVQVVRDPRTACTTAGNARVAVGALPLIDTRAHVIVRRGSGAAFTVAADGSLYFFRRSAP